MKRVLLSAFALSAMVASAQTHFTADFEGASPLTGWQNIDNDSDPAPASGTNFDLWYSADFSSYYSQLGTGTAVSRSWASNVVYTPDNILITPAINLTTAPASGLNLLFEVGTIEAAPYSNEGISVYVVTAPTLAAVLGATAAYTEVLPDGATMYSKTVDMSSYAGQTVYVAFRHHNCSDENTLLLDNIVVKNLQPNDAALEGVSVARYAQTGTNSTLSAEVTNAGSNAITSLVLNWNDGTDHSQTITTNIAPGATATVNHPTAVNYASVVERTLNVTIGNVNGVADADPSNNTGSALHNTVSQLSPKSVVIEEGTGTWCQWCPRGAVAMDYMTATYPNTFIGIAVHNGDPMTVTAYDAAADFGGYPSANVDRAILDASVSQTAFVNYYNQRINNIVPASVGGTASVSGSTITVNASATFRTVFSAANYRLAVVMVEDNVTGTTSGYNQSNAYAGGANGAMGGYESLPNPVPASQMVYDHVGRALLGGYSGQAGSIPAAISDGQTASYTFTYNVPSGQEGAQMHAVVLLIDQATGEIVNAGKAVGGSLSVEEVASINMNVYPNPASDVVNVAFEAVESNYTVNVTDLAGRVVYTTPVNNVAGATKVTIPVANFNAGNYIVTVAGANSSFNQMISVK